MTEFERDKATRKARSDLWVQLAIMAAEGARESYFHLRGVVRVLHDTDVDRDPEKMCLTIVDNWWGRRWRARNACILRQFVESSTQYRVMPDVVFMSNRDYREGGKV